MNEERESNGRRRIKHLVIETARQYGCPDVLGSWNKPISLYPRK